jgi:hypothetical protein
MYDYLDAKRLPETDNCDVYVETITESIALKSEVSSATASSLPLPDVGLIIVSIVGIILHTLLGLG